MWWFFLCPGYLFLLHMPSIGMSLLLWLEIFFIVISARETIIIMVYCRKTMFWQFIYWVRSWPLVGQASTVGSRQFFPTRCPGFHSLKLGVVTPELSCLLYMPFPFWQVSFSYASFIMYSILWFLWPLFVCLFLCFTYFMILTAPCWLLLTV